MKPKVLEATPPYLSKRYGPLRKANISLTRLQRQTVSELRQALRKGNLTFEPNQPCPLCDNSTYHIVAERDRYGLPVRTVICGFCGLLRSDPTFTQSSLERFYNSYYRRLQEGRVSSDGAHHRFQRQLKNGQRVFQRFNESRLLPAPPALIAEIGCGAGGILKVFADEGYSVTGCDMDADYLAYGRALGLDLVDGQDPDVLLKHEVEADALILRHVVEHLPKPLPFLRSLHRLLKPEGILYVEVPGLRMLEQGKKDYDFLNFLLLPHVAHYEQVTLECLLRQAGFEVLICNETIWGLFKAASPYSKPPPFTHRGAGGTIQFLRHVESMRKRHRFFAPLSAIKQAIPRIWNRIKSIPRTPPHRAIQARRVVAESSRRLP